MTLLSVVNLDEENKKLRFFNHNYDFFVIFFGADKSLSNPDHNAYLTYQGINEISRSEEFHFGGSSGAEMQHFMQFSVITFLIKCSIQCEGI